MLEAKRRSIGRPYDHMLRTHFAHWLILAENEAAVAEKIVRYFPDGLDAFWAKYLVAGTPDHVAEHYGEFVKAGVE
jgi:hypothetical protein